MLRFVLVFAVLMGLFYGVFYTPPSEDSFFTPVFPWYLSRYAQAGGAILKLIGYDITVNGQSISSPRFSVQIVRGCDAMEATALFVTGVIAFPVGLRRKVPGILVGVLLLAVFNLIRIVSLFCIGVHFRKYFNTAHHEVWQALFILLTVSVWLVWVWWATRSRTTRSHERT